MFQDNATQRSSTVFSRYEHKLMQEQVKKLRGGEYGVKLGPRAIRCFTMKYQVGRLICDKLGVEYTAEELVEAIVMCYRGDGDVEEGNKMLNIARQVC